MPGNQFEEADNDAIYSNLETWKLTHKDLATNLSNEDLGDIFLAVINEMRANDPKLNKQFDTWDLDWATSYQPPIRDEDEEKSEDEKTELLIKFNSLLAQKIDKAKTNKNQSTASRKNSIDDIENFLNKNQHTIRNYAETLQAQTKYQDLDLNFLIEAIKESITTLYIQYKDTDDDHHDLINKPFNEWLKFAPKNEYSAKDELDRKMETYIRNKSTVQTDPNAWPSQQLGGTNTNPAPGATAATAPGTAATSAANTHPGAMLRKSTTSSTSPHQNFPATAEISPACRQYIINSSRLRYGQGIKRIFPGSYNRNLIMQTGSNDFMQTYGNTLAGCNGKIPHHPQKRPDFDVVKTALYALQHAGNKVNYPWPSLDTLSTENISDEAEKKEFNEFIKYNRLLQMHRNSTPREDTFETSPLIYQRLNLFGMGSMPRAERILVMEMIIFYYGVSCSDPKDDKDGTSYEVLQEQPDGTKKCIFDVKVSKEVDPNLGMKTFSVTVKPGATPEEKERNMKLAMDLLGKHMQQNGSALFIPELGSNVYDNLRWLQMALYNWNFHIQLNPAQIAMLQTQIAELRQVDPKQAALVEQEINFIIKYGSLISPKMDRYGGREIPAAMRSSILDIPSVTINGNTLEPPKHATVNAYRKYLEERSKVMVEAIFQKPQPKQQSTPIQARSP